MQSNSAPPLASPPGKLRAVEVAVGRIRSTVMYDYTLSPKQIAIMHMPAGRRTGHHQVSGQPGSPDTPQLPPKR
jgi:hypothetical protein